MNQQMMNYHTPLDPWCPDNPLPELFADPMTDAYGIGDEMAPILESQHRQTCEACRQFGVENIEVVGP